MERWDLPDLPHKVVYNILSRLPVKPLCRFKSVSKPWLALITDPHFIKSHLHQSMNSNTNQKLILGPPKWFHISEPSFSQISEPSYSQISEPFQISEPSYPQICEPSQISEPSYSLDYQAPDPTPAELEMPWKSGVVETIWGSINGVLLVDIDEELCLWNPSIRMYQKISKPKFTCRYALGYDSINDDFKVVAAEVEQKKKRVVAAVPPTSDVPSTVHVFSSKLSSWKSIGDFGYSCRLIGRGSVLNGAPHWFARGSTDIETRYCRIACFDVMEEKFKEVPTINEVKSNLCEVGVLDGCLCTVDRRLESLTFWVMKEYGVKESWTKLYVLSDVPPNLSGVSFFDYCKLLCFTKDGEFVLLLWSGTSAKFAIYNPKRKTYKRIEKPENWQGHEIGLYVESLVSPLG